jgi:hypothetical protein
MYQARTTRNWWMWVIAAFLTGAWPVIGIIAILGIILLGK